MWTPGDGYLISSLRNPKSWRWAGFLQMAGMSLSGGKSQQNMQERGFEQGQDKSEISEALKAQKLKRCLLAGPCGCPPRILQPQEGVLKLYTGEASLAYPSPSLIGGGPQRDKDVKGWLCKGLFCRTGISIHPCFLPSFTVYISSY